MSQINDCKLKALTAVYGPGQINDLMLRFLQAQGADAGTINDAWQQVINGGISPIPPPNAIADYDFSQFSPTAAITDKVTGQKVTTTRAGNLNVVQSDGASVEAFGFNQAGFDRGVGMLVEKDSQNDARTNQTLNSFSLTNATITDTGDIAPDGFTTWQRLTATDTLQPRAETNIAVPQADTVYTWSIFARKGSNDFAALSTFDSNAIAIFDLVNGTVVSESGNIQTSIELLDNDIARIQITFEVTTTNSFNIVKIHQTNGVSIAQGDIGGFVDYWGAQLEIEPQATSPIYTGNLSISRPATIAEIPTIAELGYLIDEPSTATVPCTTSNLNESGWINGVRNLNFGNLNLNFNLGDIQSKYGAGFVNNASLIGLKVISPQGAVVQATASSNAASSIDCTIINNNGLTDEQVLESLRYPNEFTIDFTTSAYFATNDFATAVSAIAVLRQNAGDILTGFATPSQWPEDNVRISFNAEVRNDERFKYVFKMGATEGFNADELICEASGASSFALSSRNEGVASSVLVPEVAGQHLFEIDFKDGTMLLRVDGVEGNLQTATLQVGARPKVFLGAANAGHPRVLYNNFTVQSPIPTPPPEISQLTVILQGAQGANPEDVFYGNVGLPDDPQGELVPALTVDGKPFSVVSQVLPSTFGKGVIIGNEDEDWTVGRTIVASFGGVEYTFLPDVFGAGQDFNIAVCLSETLYDYLFSVAGTPIDFSIVSVVSGALPFSASSGTQNYQYNDGLYAFYKSQGAQGDQLNDLAKDFWCRLAQPQIAPLPWILSDSQGNILTDNSGTNLRT